MKLKIEQLNLSHLISLVAKAVSPRSPKPALSCVKFSAGEEGLILDATDQELWIRSSSKDVEIEYPGEVLVDARLVEEIVKNLPKSDVQIETEENKRVKITCEKSKFELFTQEVEEFPEFKPPNPQFEFDLSPILLRDMLEKVMFSASTDEIMKNLNGVYIEIEGKTIRLISADGFRMALTEKEIATPGIPEQTPYMGFLLSLRSVREISRIIETGEEEDKMHVIYDGKKIGLELNRTFVMTQRIEAEFPDYKKVLPEGFKTKITLPTNTLYQSIKRIGVVAKPGSETIRFDIADNIFQISSTSSDYGNSKEEMSIEKEGDDIAIAFNPRFLLEALSRVDDENVTLSFLGPLSPTQINPATLSDYEFIVMPIRM
ncbi:MAG: DNA polymerase III subunit beta [Thermotogae bacterium]|nr:DNA polymerase III subunit beta [Thermotogota bacterium]